ncbi:MAG: hypothetical protein K2P86_08630 [Xanthobacteraceae bacterium]|nr:hypothetical protein [Xanthobacteraceae bacterium]
MSATVHVLHPPSSAIGAFLRVGHTGFRKLEALLAANRLPIRRVVFDAAHIGEQVDLLKALRSRGYETVLDPNCAEMATSARFDSAVGNLPWGNSDRPWTPQDFSQARNLDTAKALADFAVSYGVDAVLAPTHLIESTPSPWLAVDLKLSEALRRELDRSGGKNVAIDYQLITTNAVLKDPTNTDLFVSELQHLPIDNIWLRSSGFGASATGTATRAFIEAAQRFHQANRPLVADFAGGFSGIAAAALGAIAGLSSGVGQKENFRSGDWKKPQAKGGGSAKRIYIPELDRYFKEDQLERFFETKGARARFGCNDQSCCPHGIEDMIDKPHVHFITQRSRQIENLSSIPESRRGEHFLLHHLDPAIRSARQGAKLKIADDEISKVVSDAKKRLILLRDPLSDVHANSGSKSRSRALRFRGSPQKTNKATG